MRIKRTSFLFSMPFSKSEHRKTGSTISTPAFCLWTRSIIFSRTNGTNNLNHNYHLPSSSEHLRHIFFAIPSPHNHELQQIFLSTTLNNEKRKTTNVKRLLTPARRLSSGRMTSSCRTGVLPITPIHQPSFLSSTHQSYLL